MLIEKLFLEKMFEAMSVLDFAQESDSTITVV